MRTLLIAVGVGLIAASIIFFTSGDITEVPRGALALVGGIICIVVGLAHRRSHSHRSRR